MEEHELRQISTDGSRAEKLLNDDTFKGAVSSVRNAIFERWESCDPSDRTTAHELKLMLKLLNDLRGNLQLAVEQGRMASDQLSIDKGLARKIAERLRVF